MPYNKFRMKNYKILTKILFFVILSTISAKANTDSLDSRNISVRDAIKRAEKNNPQLQKVLNEINSLSSLKSSFYSPSIPVLSYTNEGIGNDNVAESRLAFTQDFNFPLKTYYQVAAQNSKIEHLKLKYQEQYLKIREDIKIIYANLIYSNEYHRIKELQYKIADSLQIAVAMRLDAGFASELDRIKSKIYYDNSLNELKESEVNLHTARYALFNLMGLDPDLQSYNINFPDSLVYFEINIIQKEVLQKMKNYSGYLAELENVNSIKEEYNVSKSEYLPDLSFSIYNQSFKVGDPAFGYEIGVKLPIWFLLDQSPKITSKQYEIEMANNNQYSKYLELKQEIEYAWHKYDISRNKIKRFTVSIINDARKLLDLTFEAYLAGRVDLINLLDAQRIYLDNEIKYYEELKEYYSKVIILEKFLNEEIVFK